MYICDSYIMFNNNFKQYVIFSIVIVSTKFPHFCSDDIRLYGSWILFLGCAKRSLDRPSTFATLERIRQLVMTPSAFTNRLRTRMFDRSLSKDSHHWWMWLMRTSPFLPSHPVGSRPPMSVHLGIQRQRVCGPGAFVGQRAGGGQASRTRGKEFNQPDWHSPDWKDDSVCTRSHTALKIICGEGSSRHPQTIFL